MIRATAFVLVAFALIAPAPAAPVPKHLMKGPTLYYPTEVGAKWVYTVCDADDATGREVVEVVMSVLEPRGEPGVKYVEVGTLVEGKSHSVGYHVAVSAGGLAEGKFEGPEKFVRRTTTLRVPDTLDSRWEVKIEGRGDCKAIHTFRGAEEVEVPAGKFTALRVDTEYQYAHAAWQMWHRWYAPGVGLVKAERVKGQRPPASITKVLKEFAPAGK